jgi:hypothetical protein
MKYFSLAIALAAAAITIPALGADVGVSVSIGEPGFYGQLDLGNFERPSVQYSRPVIIRRVRGAVLEPVYLRVPRDHAKNWRRYCDRYNACDRPVYFVRDDWYNNVYVPHYRDQRQGDRDRNERGNNERRDDEHGNKRDSRRDDRDDKYPGRDDRGH